MSIIKEKILFNNEDINLKININFLGGEYGSDQEIKHFTKDTANTLINPVIDKEIQQFTFNGLSDKKFIIEFYDAELPSHNWGNLLTYAGFTNNEVKNYSKNLRNSFFILDFFDEVETNKRIKITTKYYTKIIEIIGGEEYEKGVDTKNVFIEQTNQLRNIELPNSFLEEKVNTLYCRILFYNAKTGRLIPIYNHLNENKTNEERVLFQINLNHQNKTWDTEDPNIWGREILENIEYGEKINETNKNLETFRTNYPTEKYFDYENIDYLDIP